MYSRDKMKELLTERDKLDVYDEYHTDIVWGKILDLLQSREDIDKFAEYMDKEMTYDEYGTLGEIIDEIDYKYITKKFVESLKKLIDKYPCKTIPKEWNDNSYEKHMLRVFEEELADREKEKN